MTITKWIGMIITVRKAFQFMIWMPGVFVMASCGSPVDDSHLGSDPVNIPESQYEKSKEKSTCGIETQYFSSYDQAINAIRNATWDIAEQASLSSSWIAGVEYYCCRGIPGYLLVKLKDGKTYLHGNVPEHIYTSFLNASSKGRYYNEVLKGNYTYRLSDG